MRSTVQKLSIFLAAILQIAVTFLPRMGLGTDIGERSDAVHTLITPAGWTFSIWGPLYAGSIAYAIYQWLPSQRDNDLLERIGWASAGAFAGNAIWALYVQFNALDAVSILIIAATLGCLFSIFRLFALVRQGFSTGEKWAVVLPLSALCAWLTVATIVNVAATLRYYGVESNQSAPFVAAGMILMSGVIAALALRWSRGNPWYALTYLWALAGIAAESGRESTSVLGATILSAILAIAVLVAALLNNENRAHWLGRRHDSKAAMP